MTKQRDPTSTVSATEICVVAAIVTTGVALTFFPGVIKIRVTFLRMHDTCKHETRKAFLVYVPPAVRYLSWGDHCEQFLIIYFYALNVCLNHCHRLCGTAVTCFARPFKICLSTYLPKNTDYWSTQQHFNDNPAKYIIIIN